MILQEVTLVTPDEVSAARQALQTERRIAQEMLTTQLAGKTTVSIHGCTNSHLNGDYRRAPEDYDGWPCFVSDAGLYLFRVLPANAWRVCPTLGPRPVGESTIQAITMDGTIPVGQPNWSLLRLPHWYPEVQARAVLA
eukprot:COSAG03_NODE_3168_length_2168_cov_1.752537_2_plen_138_part_00